MPETNQSQSLYDRARKVIPGGVNSPVRAFGAVGGTPRFIAEGQGAYLTDVDGNRYLDYVASWGPLILGHRHPEITAEAEQAVRAGSSFGAPTQWEIDLAEDRKSTRLNSSHVAISYAVFCLKKKNNVTQIILYIFLLVYLDHIHHY